MPIVPNIHLNKSFILLLYNGIIRICLIIISNNIKVQLKNCLKKALVAVLYGADLTNAAIIEKENADKTINNIAL